MTAPRAPCVVPGCRNSSAKYARSRYICSAHWRLVPRRLKRRRSRIERLLQARGLIHHSEPRAYWECETRRAWALLNTAWLAMERAAIQGAAGL